MTLGWLCPIRALLGLPCPACGLTRATLLVVQGDLRGALAMHPLVWLVTPLVALLVALELRGYAMTRAWGASARVRGMKPAMLVVAALLFGVWIARFLGAFGGPVSIAS